MGRSDVAARSLPRVRARLAIAVLALASWGQIVQAQTPSRQPSAWDLRWFVGISVVVVLLQGALIAALLLERARRARVERGVLESEERFRLMADTAPVLLWRAGPDKLCDFFNRPWLEFTGRTMEQEVGNGWSEGVSPEDLDRCLRTYEAAFDARRPFQMDTAFAEPTAYTDGSATTVYRDTNRTAVSPGTSARVSISPIIRTQ